MKGGSSSSTTTKPVGPIRLGSCATSHPVPHKSGGQKTGKKDERDWECMGSQRRKTVKWRSARRPNMTFQRCLSMHSDHIFNKSCIGVPTSTPSGPIAEIAAYVAHCGKEHPNLVPKLRVRQLPWCYPHTIVNQILL